MPDCRSTGGRQEEATLTAAGLLHNKLEARIYLPGCYDLQAERRFPVLYMFHGQFYQNDQWIELGLLTRLEALAAAGEIEPFIIVFPYDTSARQPSEYPFAGAVGGVLVPYVDTTYRTLAERGQRAVGGLSRGAGWAIHLGLNQPETFGHVGAHSPIVFWEDGAHINDWLNAIPLEIRPGFYLDIGDHDTDLANAEWLRDLLDLKGYQYEWHLNSGYHNAAYWLAHLDEYLRWYDSQWRAGGP